MARAAHRARRHALKVRSGDQVLVTAGKDRGKSGRVLRVEPKKERVYVDGLNMVKRHVRPKQVAGAHTEAALGGVIEREGPIHVSNVMLLDAKGNPTRVAIEREGGQRVRVAKRSGARFD
ncbi:MAG: 50S ribosomal protein L24 [Actinobacteria bacterium]|nr:MAG: 50S ribosomal protein L24 [Actinomycetota bacterium]